jgi:nucleoside phosphorylase/HEAT repeat protein
MDQEEIHRKCQNSDPYERIEAIDLLSNLVNVQNKKQMWEDLIKLTSEDFIKPLISRGRIYRYKQSILFPGYSEIHKENYVRKKATEALGTVFQYIHNKNQAWEDLHRLSSDKDQNVRAGTAGALGTAFQYIHDNNQAWEDLHRLTSDRCSEVKEEVASALGTAFKEIPDKRQVWKDLHRLTSDRYSRVRGNATRSIGVTFQYIPDKNQAWDDLHRLTSDKYSEVREKVASALGTAFIYFPEKIQAWKDLQRLTLDEDPRVRINATNSLGIAFQDIPDENQAWDDLLRLSHDENGSVRWRASKAFIAAFQYAPDKNQAWDELIRSISSGSISVSGDSENILVTAFQCIPDKNKAWEDLVRLASNDNVLAQYEAVRAMGTPSFQHVSDTNYAWESLVKLTSHDSDGVRLRAVDSMGSVFQYIPDKYQAWEYLHRFTSDEDSYVRMGTALALRTAFQHVPDKKQAWEDLVKLIADVDFWVAWRAKETIVAIFQKIPDKIMACEDLHRLTFNENMRARSNSVEILGATFQHIPSKELAWEDLDRLALDINAAVRMGAVNAIGTAYQHVPDKGKAFLDLCILSLDEIVGNRVRANHYLGKICIYRASQSESEEEYLNELASSIGFFEESSKESNSYNPSSFCLPFYRSFYMIIHAEKQQAKNEVEQYLAEAKEAVGGSKNKKLLFEAVENLSQALEKVQNLKNMGLEAKKEELNFYRTYCEQAAELMSDTEEAAPSAVQVLRKGFPILDRKLKSLLEEIQEKATTACRESQGTDTEEIACAVSREIQKWEIGNQEEMTLYVESFIFTLESKIPRLPENEYIFNMINESKNQKDLKKLLERTSELIEIIPEITIDPERMKPTIGIITALPKEYAAVNVLLENKNDKYKIPGYGAGRQYCLGETPTEEGSKHNLVLAMVDMGNNMAAARASLLLEHFPNVKSIIMVGIAGGVPNPFKVEDHVRLGDIVVSNESGVIQYDLIKQEIQQTIHRNPPRPPSASLLQAVKYLEVEEILGNRPWEKYIDQAISIIKTIRPSENSDVLYSSDNQKLPIEHPEDPKRIKGQPRIFTGSIASANILQKDPKARDKLREKFGVKAIEMEASGIADATWNHEVGYLVVRGICDYCDSKKNDDWQQYAAVVAAAYTRALIESMP